ncbi:Na+/H+ antiporter [Chryseolinea sp. T2]|uniref:Na+/H+ antiporter n=1 Tax=Chryseolinea sp. T2 TaxID=3129255 RepID=UPI003076A4EC
MIDQFPFYLALIIAILLIIMLANKIKVAYPVLLVMAGLLISIVPGLPVLHIDPELIFIIFLPPLLYDAAFAISWKELWRWRRIISSFAFIVVFLTATSVAIAANFFIPGISLALGFLLGGIVSPPDAVSASAILKFVKVPRRMSSILEGESLLNDASSLIIFRFALIAVATGQFFFLQATLTFVWMVIGGVGVGLLVAWLFMKAHRYLPTDENMDIVLTLVAPYVMYIAAEEVHSSGVLAVVSGGLFQSVKRHDFLRSSSRLRGGNVWQSLVFVLNGLVFMLIGLDLSEITGGLAQEGVSVTAAIGYGLLVTGVLILVRIFAAYGAVLTTVIVGRFATVADRNPGLKAPTLLGWTGMRGVVSLAAALSIPIHLTDGVPFPHRNLILFITFIVITATLVVQGLTLPWLIKKIELPDYKDYIPDHDAEILLKRGLAQKALGHLTSQYGDQATQHNSLRYMVNKWESKTNGNDADLDMPEEQRAIYLDVIKQQREWLLTKNSDDGHIDEEVIRKYLQQLDIEEEKLRFM